MRKGFSTVARAAILVGAGLGSAWAQTATPGVPAQRSLFPEGQCSGLLCETVGGPQAPSAQRPPAQRSLFPEGECGGLFCEGIGGEQAPKHTEPPPACGGGLLCQLAPYKMGVPMTASEAARIQAERQAAATQPLPAPTPSAPRHRRAKARKVAGGTGARRE